MEKMPATSKRSSHQLRNILSEYSVFEKMERYKWNPADYAEHSHAQYLWAWEVIAKLDLNGTE